MRSRRVPLGVVIAAIGAAYYLCNTQQNPVTGEKRHVALSTEQEVALGLQTAPQMAAEFGGLHPDAAVQDYVERLGEKIVAQSAAKGSDYQYDFYVLADPETVNAFARASGLYSESGLRANALIALLREAECWTRDGAIGREKHRLRLFWNDVSRVPTLDPAVLRELADDLSGAQPEFERIAALRRQVENLLQQHRGVAPR